MNAPIMAKEAAAGDDFIATRFMLPPDAKCLPVSDLAARLREKIGPVEAGQAVITRPGFRLVPRLVPGPLAALVGEFREPSLITDAVLRYSRARGEEPLEILDDAFDALATLIEGRMLVPEESHQEAAPEPSLGAGQDFAGYEILSLVRSLDDTELYKARSPDGREASLKIARDDRPAVASILAHEAAILVYLEGRDSPALYGQGAERGRSFIAIEWVDGVSIATAAQQARAARDAKRLHRLIWKLFLAYARLHRAGVLHGDVHPGNILAGDDGRVVILDFGAAVRIGAAFAPARGGIAHFHDPQMAAALLARAAPPPACTASEQYGLAVLAYLLVTGLHPMPGSAVHEELLRQIAERPPLPFAARSIPAAPEMEAVLARALAKAPGARFTSIFGLARSWANAAPWRTPRAKPPRMNKALRTLLDDLRTLSLPPTKAEGNLANAWLACRAGIILEDYELLAAAEILVGRAGTGWAAQSVAVKIARARSDHIGEAKALKACLADAETLPEGPNCLPALLAAADLLDGSAGRPLDAAPLARWAAARIDRALAAATPGTADSAAAAHAALRLGRTRAMSYHENLPPHLEALDAAGQGDVSLWSEAHFAWGREDHRRLALAVPLPKDPAARAFALLRLHQLTGETHWIDQARPLAAGHPLLTLELRAPERAVYPPHLT